MNNKLLGALSVACISLLFSACGSENSASAEDEYSSSSVIASSSSSEATQSSSSIASTSSSSWQALSSSHRDDSSSSSAMETSSSSAIEIASSSSTIRNDSLSSSAIESSSSSAVEIASSSSSPRNDNSSSSVMETSSSSAIEIASSSSTIRNDNSSSSSETTQSSSSSENISAGSVYDATAKTLKDLRDGKTYKTVTIGDQTWMADNLNYETENSYCYDDDPSNCAKYGRLYTWAAAMDSVGKWSTNGKGCGFPNTCSPTYPVRGICPEGWHLPDTTEWKTLFTAVGGSSTAGTALKSTSGWDSSGNGTDSFGFSALPAGYRYDDGDYNNEGYYADFWSSTERNSRSAYYMLLRYDVGTAHLFNNLKNHGFSVRCLKD